MILDRADGPSHLSNWLVAEQNGRVVGAINSFVLGEQPQPTARSAAVLQPLNELKAVVVGSWYVAVASVHAEFRGRGIGRMLLSHAEGAARDAKCEAITLMVGSFNDDARRLYERLGFEEQQRRPYEPFPGSDPFGDWILMAKPI